MSDLRDRLERLSDRTTVAPDAFERLERTRRRRERNRRIAAGTVALLVAVAGTVTAFAAFRQPGGQVPAAGGGTGATAPALGASAGVAEFTCDATGTIGPRSVAVDAQPDGVHVALTNLADERVSFTAGGGVDALLYVAQAEADPGQRTEIVVGIPPGSAHVSCRLASAGGIDTSPMAALRVNDPTGSYLPVGMNCSMVSQDTPKDVSLGGDPVEIARQHLSGLEYDDTVEPAGYPEGDQAIVRVVRAGEVVATATFRGNREAGWGVDALVTCANVPIGWSAEVAGVSGPNGSPTDPNAWEQLCGSARADGPGTAHNGSDLTIEGSDLRFDTRCLIAPAGRPLTITVHNGDVDIARNVSIYPLTPYLRDCIVSGTPPSKDVDHPLFEAELVVGFGETGYRVGPLEPGEYYFQDDIHPFANGVLVVE